MTTTTFAIDGLNNIFAFATREGAEASIGAGAQAFASEKEFGKVTAEWPINRFVEIWNGFAGTPGFDKLKEVKKFENRAKATARIWAAIQALAEREHLDLSRCSAYSDSSNDMPMLLLVGHPHVVNPDAELRAEARRRGWPVHDFRSGRRATTIALPIAAAAGALAGGTVAGVALHRRRTAGSRI